MEPDSQTFHIPDPIKCALGPGDARACPRIYRSILKSENLGQTISDPGQKLIAYTLPSIWYDPLFFKNNIKISVNRQNQQNQNLCIVLPIVLSIVLPIVLPIVYCIA